MENFRRLSCDDNPLHTDDTYARQLGFEGRVVYGALIVARISCLIGMHLPGPGGVWAGLKMDFRSPLYIDEEAALNGTVTHRSEAAKLLTLGLRIDTVDRCIATGSAEAVFRAHG